MFSATQLREKIREEANTLERLHHELEESYREVEEAKERRRLRGEWQDAQDENAALRLRVGTRRSLRCAIDEDEPYSDEEACATDEEEDASPVYRMKQTLARKETIAYGTGVAKREYTWEIQGVSWLTHSLEQERRQCSSSEPFQVDPTDCTSKYVLVFSPNAESLDVCKTYASNDSFSAFDACNTKGTLALIRKADHFGTNVDVRFFVQGAGRVFKQWGDRRRVVVPARAQSQCFVIGPDLDSNTKGVFGLPFEALLRSEWVHDDAIAFKVVIEEDTMRAHPDHESGHIDVGRKTLTVEDGRDAVEVPHSRITADLLSMLTDGCHSDVTITAIFDEAADPVHFAAHAGILSKRSPVFAAALSHGMRESETRTITVRDHPPLALKALLHFLYTDDFEQVQAVLAEERDTSAHDDRSSAEEAAAGRRVAQLQAVLAAAHKYQVPRLLRWCEAQLCKHLSSEAVCSLLSLASLYEATELECSCLDFMKAHMADVVAQPDFAALSSACMLKFNMHVAGVGAHKRKREM